LHYAAGIGNKDLAELLLSKGADVNAVNNKGVTPLAVAIQNGHDAVILFLRAHGGKE